VAGRVRELGRRAFTAGGDLAERGTAERIIDGARSALGRLDYLVANAGIWPPEAVPLRDLSDARRRDTMAANLDGIFETVRAALRSMDEGSMVLVSSTAGQRGEAFHADYAATKGALISLTKSLAVECAPRITVNCVAPGWIDTEMSDSAY